MVPVVIFVTTESFQVTSPFALPIVHPVGAKVAPSKFSTNGSVAVPLYVTTVAAEEALLHPPVPATITEYDPAALTVIACVVAPLGVQVLPEVALEVNVTVVPGHKLVIAPPAVIVGVAGVALTTI